MTTRTAVLAAAGIAAATATTILLVRGVEAARTRSAPAARHAASAVVETNGTRLVAMQTGALPPWETSASGPLRPLPDGVRLLEYVEATGSQYVDTGLTYFPDFEVGVQMRESVGNNTLGVGNGGKFGRNSAAKPTWKLIVSNTSLISEIHVTSRIDASYRNGVFSGNGTVVATKQNPFSSGQMLLFSTGASLPTAYPCVMFYCRLIDQSGVLVRDYIPAKDANGIAGLFDLVSGTMFYSATATPLVAGPELVPETPDFLSHARRNWYAPALLATNPPLPTVSGHTVTFDALVLPEGLYCTERSAGEFIVAERPMIDALVGRYRAGLAPAILPVNVDHAPPARGLVTRLWAVAGSGLWARIEADQAAVADKRYISAELLCLTATATDALGTWGTFSIPWHLTGVALTDDPAIAGTHYELRGAPAGAYPDPRTINQSWKQ